MRPLSLKMQNFGPYKNEIVDFTQFDNVPLFLISGKTGSGKTTIFDGICYALFGETSGNERKPQQMRSSFAEGNDKTIIELEFEHQGKKYRISREPSYQYINQKGGVSAHQPKNTLYYTDVNGEEATLTKTKDIRIFIEELLHLNAKQFTQIVLLPQQQFRKFLSADSKDKEGVLRQVFGTEIFEKWTDQIRNQTSDLKKKNEQQQSNLKTLMSTVSLEAEEHTQPVTPQDWLEIVTIKVEKLNKEITDQKEEIAKEELNLKDKSEALNQAKDLKNAIDEQTQLNQVKAALEEQKEMIRHKEQLVRDLEWAQKLKPLTINLKSDTENKEKIDNQIEKIATALKELEKKNQENFETKEKLKQQMPQIEELKTQIQANKPKLDLYDKVQAARDEFKNEHLKLDKVVEENQQINDKLQKVDQDLKQGTKKVQQIGDLTEKADKIAQLEIQVNKIQQKIDHINDLKKELNVNAKKLSDIKSEVSKQQEITAELKANAEQLQNYFAQNQINFYVKQLKTGEACPICGSTEHPHPAKISVPSEMENITEEDVQRAQNSYTRASQKLSQVQEKQAEIERQLSVTQEAIKEEFWKLNQENQTELQLTEIDDYLQEKQKYFEKQKQEYKNLQEEKKKLESQNEQLAKQKEMLQNQVDEYQQSKSNAEKKVTELKAQIETQEKMLPVDYSTKEELESSLEKWQRRADDFQNQKEKNTDAIQKNEKQQVEAKTEQSQLQKQRSELQVKLEKNQQTLDSELSQKEVTENHLKELIDKLDQLPNWRDEINRYHQEVHSVNDQLEHVQQKIKNQQLPDIDRLQKEVDDLSVSIGKKQTEVGNRQAVYGHLKQTKERVSTLWNEQQTAQHHLDELLELTQVITGGTSENKLGLERYVLREYFKEVLDVATQILEKITNGRYAFVLQENAERNTARQTGLGIDVYDDEIGQKRSVHTLSGGESFIAALSLALALGEVIQRQNGGTEIDTLFIDEGFGSLDEDSLQTAMETLRTLEGENRMVGIISHVRELHDQIPDQINVISHDGQSHIKYRHEI